MLFGRNGLQAFTLLGLWRIRRHDPRMIFHQILYSVIARFQVQKAFGSDLIISENDMSLEQVDA